MADNPILNSPYEVPTMHYATASDGSLDYSIVEKGRRPFDPENVVNPTRQPAQRAMTFSDQGDPHQEHIINLCRKEISRWRSEQYPNTTRVTRDLLSFWFANSERINTKKLFF